MHSRSLLSRLITSYATPPWLPTLTFISSRPTKARLYASRISASTRKSLPPPWEEHEKETVKKGIEDGLTYVQIAKLLPGRSYQAVCMVGQQQGISRKLCWQSHEIETLKKGIKDGLTYVEIAKLLPGRNSRAVLKAAKRQGISKKNSWKSHEIETLKKGTEDRLTSVEIAKLLPGRTSSAILKAAKQQGFFHSPLWSLWQSHEIETLKKGIEDGLTYFEIAKLLPGRSKSAVASCAHKQGFSKKRPSHETVMFQGLISEPN